MASTQRIDQNSLSVVQFCTRATTSHGVEFNRQSQAGVASLDTEHHKSK